MSRRVAAVAFDVNETLFSLDRLGERLVEAGLPPEALQVWFGQVLRDGLALAATGGYAPFRELARTHLRRLLVAHGTEDPDGEAERVFAAFAELDAHPDVEPSLARLQAAGLAIVTLTNGHADSTERLLARNGLDGFVRRCLSVDDTGIWKPRSRPYLHAAQACGVAPEQLAMVAVHSWDVHGAKLAGLVTGYASRLEGGFVDGFHPPDIVAADLVEVVDGLLDL
ncbi:MAG TPA: haloacid dehalogenase type II [Egibacteraceae bacterium]|nr:haloacid dehalogenase type II [Egibacteraceae bacterium]